MTPEELIADVCPKIPERMPILAPNRYGMPRIHTAPSTHPVTVVTPPQITMAYASTPQLTSPVFHVSCTGNTPADNVVDITTPGLGTFTFDDDGKSHVIDQSVPAAGTMLKYTITPAK